MNKEIKMEKRGVSPVVATVLLVMLTLLAVVILGRYLIGFVRTELPKTTECLSYKDYFKFQESFETAQGSMSYNCYIKTDNNYKYGASIKATSMSEDLAKGIKGFKLVFAKEGGDSVVVDISNDTIPSINGIKELNKDSLRIPSRGNAYTYVYNAGSGNLYNSVEVHPVLVSGSICPASDTIDLGIEAECKPGVGLG